jgi:hypothetical protein
LAGSKQVIHQAELWPALLSRFCWATRFVHRRVLLFVDNDGARASLIRGDSVNSSSRAIVWSFHNFYLVRQTKMWVARVPSPSNVADDPSRLEFRTNEILFQCLTIPMPSVSCVEGGRPWETRLHLL